ncbi:MAG TPA: LysM peptidoglycan-binding domain-containing M23 family metallopeptidase [Azospirillaceae bacterium]|nr:LysM peptidoglycan-binding domain-containing M23 family metallopeptidase [Azospirillaceae bacterium]
MRLRLVLAAALLLAGCAETVAPPPRPAAPVTPAPANSIFVSRGETVYDIAKRYGVPLRDLLEANRLAPPYNVQAGQRLVLPTPREYQVRAGDTLYGIARTYNVDVSELVRLNAIAPPYGIQAGRTLRLPSARAMTAGQGAGQGTQVAAARPPAPRPTASAPAPAARPTVTQAPPPAPVTSAPAGTPTRGGIEVAELPPPGGGQGRPLAPSVPAPATQPARQGVEAAPLPPQTATQAGPPPISQPSAVAPAAGPGAIAPVPSPAEPPPQQVAALPPPAPPPAPVEAPPPRSAGRFAWPVSGTMLSSFGPKPGGAHNDGINIGAPKGTPVVASEDGVVAYSGNELRGFGNLLLIRHGDGFVTAYAHLDTLLVERGARVTRGQRIGTVGATGNVRGPQLHFEIRKGNQALDPMEQLERR